MDFFGQIASKDAACHAQHPKALDLFKTYMLLGQTSGDLVKPSAETPEPWTTEQRICSYHCHHVCYWLLSQNKYSPLNTWKSCWCKKTNKTRGKQTTVTELCFWLVQLQRGMPRAVLAATGWLHCDFTQQISRTAISQETHCNMKEHLSSWFSIKGFRVFFL